MSEIPTITEFLESTGARLRLFDMGRRIVKLSRDEFLKFERNEIRPHQVNSADGV